MNRSFVSSFIIACLASATPVRAADPGWWADRGVKNSTPASNLSPATIGQAKHMAAMALEELADGLPAAEFAALESDVAAVVDLTPFQPPPGVNPAPPPPGYVPVGHRVLLVGQLKALAKPFYDHLRLWNAVWLDNEMIAANIRVVEPGSNPPEYSPYPWSVATSDDQNMAVANLGQLKAVFSVRLETVPAYDTDGDGMPDAWEMQHGLDPVANDSGRDPDMDGLTNLQEFLISTDPSDPDSDGDLLPDGWENTYGFDPLTKDLDALTADPDGDGFSNFLESVYGTDPYDASSVPPCTPDVEIILPPPPPDDPPPPPPPPATAGADWHFEVVTARKYLPKYGITEFIDSTPPKRYLLKSETVSFKLLGNEGENPESPINGARLTTVDPLTGGQTIEDHQHKGSNNERNDNMDGSVEPQTATAALGVTQVSSYDDEPNQRGDRNAIKTLKVVLDEENTNEMLVANVIAELPPYPAEYSDGSPQAYRDLLEDELGIDYQKASYRIVWNDGVAPEDRHAVSHLVVFEPEDDPSTVENESEVDVEVVKVVEWNGLGEESPAYEIDPETEKPGEDGRYFLLSVEVTVVFGIGPITPHEPTSRELLESYLETVKIARTGNLWVVKGKDVAGAEKLYCVEVANTEEKLLSALGTEGMAVVFDGHANFGIGPNFSLGMFKHISDFTNFGVEHTDIQKEYRGDGTEPDAMPYFELTEQDLIDCFVDPINPTEEEWALSHGHRHLKDEGWGYLLLDPEEIMGDFENELVPFVDRWRYDAPGKDHAGAIIEKQGAGFNNEWHFDYPDQVEGANYHLIIKTPDSDLPQLRYKTFFYNACDTGLHYIENFQHGDFVYTKRACNVRKATQAFVKRLIEGKTPEQATSLLDGEDDADEETKVITYAIKKF